MADVSLASRFAGSMVGTFVGDALGRPFEGMTSTMVSWCWSKDRPMLQGGRYTDDTQMMIGVAESLVTCGGFDVADMARRFVVNHEPTRGYGAGAHHTLTALRQGCQWDEAATLVFPEGSFGNGAAMRVAPIGLLYHDDPAELRRVAELSASITHGHPLGKEGAALQAYAVACAARSEPADFDRGDFLEKLKSFVRIDVFQRKLDAVGNLLDPDVSVKAVAAGLGNYVTAHESVPASIYAFLAHPDSFQDAVSHAVSLGGDTDTIGAMTGAIAGALHGLEAIPPKWFEAMENESKGRDYVLELARQLHDQHVEMGNR